MSSFYSAGSLDARNINSIITINHNGRTHIGTIATIEHIGDRTEIFLAHGEDALSIPAQHVVSVQLDPATNSAFYTTKALEVIRDLLEEQRAAGDGGPFLGLATAGAAAPKPGPRRVA